MKKEKGYLVTKISDQKEKEYAFYTELKTNEQGLPLEEELDLLVDKEKKEKSVGLFIGNDYMKMFCFKSISKFNKRFLREYIDSYENKCYETVYWYTNEQNANFIKEEIEEIKEQFLKMENKNGYVRK